MLVALTGPTASGKTALSFEIARAFSCEIISADSRQFYREMNIGTAKVSSAEMQGIPHHFIDFLPVQQDYNVGQYETEVITFLSGYFQHHRIALLVGGSGLYVQAVCEGLDEIPPSDKTIRTRLAEQLKEQGLDFLLGKLKSLDKKYFDAVDKKNPHRILRALEVCEITGIPYSSFRKKATGALSTGRNFNILKIGLELPREELYRKINERVDLMFSQGLEEEARQLFPYRKFNALKTVGYEEMFQYLENKISFENAVELIKRNTRRFAKRQMTWFRKDTEIHWFHPEEKDKILFCIKSFPNG